MNVAAFSSLSITNWNYASLFLHATISDRYVLPLLHVDLILSILPPIPMSVAVKDFSTASSSSPPAIPVKVIPLQHPDSTSSNPLCHHSVPFNIFFSRWTEKIKRMTFFDWIDTIFPCFLWIRTYRWQQYFKLDLMAGITVGIMLVPQAMSYARLAGLQPIYGLYSSFVPVFVYAVFGSSRQLAVGPVALVSLLVSNALSGIADPSEELYTELAILLALLVGIFECIMGFLRLGWLTRFISHSVISGFTTASAVVIGLSQLKYFLGYSVSRSSKIVPLIESIIAGADQFKWPPFLLGSTILIILLVMKHVGKAKKELQFVRAAGPLTGLALGTTIAKVFHPPFISLVGDIPQGLPEFSFPNSFDHAKLLLPTAALITGVAILESVGIAKALAARNRYELDSNSELFGLGVANIFGSLFSAYPTTGSFSRSAVNSESEAKTGLSGLITGAIIGCSLLFLTPMFKYIPQCALAAIVISAVSGLVDYEGAIFLWRVDKRDFTLWTITSTTTLFFGIEIGVLIGVGVSLAFVIHESANPHIAVLGRLPGTTVYRNIKQYPEAYTYNGIVIVRIDAPIYFANISYIKDRLREYEVAIDKRTNKGPDLERIYFVILELSHSSAVEAIKKLYEEYKTRDIQLAISNPNKEVLLILARSGIVELIGREWFYVRVHDAVQVCLHHVQTPPTNVEESSNNTSLWRRSSAKNSSSYAEVKPDTNLLKEPLVLREN
ncbi:PREDICTED: probable sulfate transporter 4.2 isoform X2 [Camelina sativa]|uniref:Probable sulfate transporter 4.2 isoform X2 n=1 Tax=Camelina sativa TaxID=90675 RepID=A0ABM0XJN8_CAMSA|nr:PREDICTED: probable sulfate transporter 4.2 isoform X2 [Camelina sativa]